MIVCSSCNQKVVIMESLASCERLQNQKAGMLVPQEKGYLVKCMDCIAKEEIKDVPQGGF